MELSASLGEVGPAASHGVPLVATLDRLGEEVEAERLLLAALEQRPTSTRPDHLYVGYWSVSARLGRLGQLNLAERFQREAVAMAERSGDPVLLAEAYRQLAEVLEQRGRVEQAIATLDRSTEQIQAIESESARVYLGTMNRLARARVLAVEDPQSALAELDAATSYLRSTRFEHLLPRVLVERSAHHRAPDEDGEAEADLLEAAALIEGHRGGIEDPHYRISIYREAQRVYQQLALEVHDEDPARAFRYADRARSRVLSDWLREGGQRLVGGASESSQAPGTLLADVLRALPEGGVLIEYFLAPDSAIAWTLSAASGLRQVRLPVGGGELGRLIERLDRAWGDQSRMLRGLEELHAVLIGPLDLSEAVSSVVIVPQGPLETVPFSALRDARSGDFLIERFSVTLSPSAELITRSLGDSGTGSRPRRTLIVGDPAFDAQRYPGLRRLPGARREGESIHDLYTAAGVVSELLVDLDATRDGLLRRMQAADLVHLAAHGLPAAGRPLASQVVLAKPAAGVSGQVLNGLDVST
ncbi:MAG: CHAT domain-containing protein, partial [Candidatus Rokuibacteriota bacterium]